MSIPRITLIGSVCLFAAIGIVAFLKKNPRETTVQATKPVQAPMVPHTPPTSAATLAKSVTPLNPIEEKQELKKTSSQQIPAIQKAVPTPSTQTETSKLMASVADAFPQMDRIHQLFTTKGFKLPIVDTVTYNSRVDWLKGRPAWIADYAAHYATSRHFIARSLNGKPDYFSQKISTGGRFNVFRTDKDIQFYILIDISRCKSALYYFDKGTNERVLLKTYTVSLGRTDPHAPSGCLTPLGLYSLGNKIAIYQPGITAPFAGKKEVEMVRVFGTRWIPFDQEIEGCTSPSRGFGIHGLPLETQVQPDGNVLVEDRALLGTYTSDGGVRFAADDVEEIFSIVITKPTFILLVKDFHEARLPGIEVDIPNR